MRRVFSLSIAAIIYSTPAFSQVVCDERSVIVETLAGEFNEHSVGNGVANNGAVVELFVSPSGTWTIIISAPDELTCLAASGDRWLPRPVEEEGT